MFLFIQGCICKTQKSDDLSFVLNTNNDDGMFLTVAVGACVSTAAAAGVTAAVMLLLYHLFVKGKQVCLVARF